MIVWTKYARIPTSHARRLATCAKLTEVDPRERAMEPCCAATVQARGLLPYHLGEPALFMRRARRGCERCRASEKTPTDAETLEDGADREIIQRKRPDAA